MLCVILAITKNTGIDMRKFILLSAGFILLTLMHRCAVPPGPERGKAPTVRIGIVEAKENVTFTATDAFDVSTHDGKFLLQGNSGDKCQVYIEGAIPAEVKYQLVVKTAYDEQMAQQIQSDVNSKGLPAVIKRQRHRMVRNGRLGNFPVYKVCLQRIFNNEISAKDYRQQISSLLWTSVQPFIDKLPDGIMRLRNLANGEEVESRHYLRVSGNGFNLDVRVGEGYHFENTETRSYTGLLNFVIDRFGKVTVVNSLPIEKYLSGVVASEMNPAAPIEAVKSQSVAARGYTLSRLNMQHPLDPFDLCDEVHCQVYGGTRRANENTQRAVRETSGKVLMNENNICETYYLAVCGGHTENNENVWDGKSLPYLRGIFDLPEEQVTVPEDFLFNERNVRRWIEEKPRVYCNLDLIETPSYLEYAKKYFRWEVKHTQYDMQRIIRAKSGKDVGQIIDIIPRERGISGRLIKVEIKGTAGSFVIEKELEIRKALSDNYLYSSCFVVDRVIYDGGVPSLFVIKGAGWGHGVGMCQTGAAVMAMKGSNYRDILE
ncbi:SpoIID/LytB domain-containing protein, partial [candidate division KSB1 bacterium]|nr:SpoIID/LytB domain-containing protein [candidate division KSB1 bacterium]